MTTATRYDFLSLPIVGSEIDQDTGYLKVRARTARTGLQKYRRADGSIETEYRPEEEVAKPETLASFGMKPVTWRHPPTLLDAENTKIFQIGHAGSHVHFSDGFVEVALLVTDKKSIENIQRKDSPDHAVQVSAGYRVDYDPTPGRTPSGEAYDGVQRNIRVNHIAIVPQGRAGPEVRLLLDRLDSTSAVSFDQELLDPPESVTPAFPAMTTVRINLDGIDVDVASDAAPLIQAFVRDSAKGLGELRTENTRLTEELATIKADWEDLEAEKEAAEGRADGLQVALDEGGAAGEIKLDEDNIDAILAQIPVARIDALVTSRLDTLRTLAPAFEDDFVFDGIEENDLYMAAYENLFGETPDDAMSIELMRGRVEGALATLDSKDDEEQPSPEPVSPPKSRSDAAGDSTGRLRTALRGVQRRDAATASEGYSRRTTEDWKRPLTASRNR
jgi:hypothetical protein